MNLQAGKCSQYIRLGFESTDKESFLTNLNAFSNEVEILGGMSDKFENTLAKHKIKKITV